MGRLSEIAQRYRERDQAQAFIERVKTAKKEKRTFMLEGGGSMTIDSAECLGKMLERDHRL